MESIISTPLSAAPPLNIPSESQTFTSNGTFTAPDNGSYIVILNVPIAKTGSGGRGGYAATAQYNWAVVGGAVGSCTYNISDFQEEYGETGSYGTARVIGNIGISWGDNT